MRSKRRRRKLIIKMILFVFICLNVIFLYLFLKDDKIPNDNLSENPDNNVVEKPENPDNDVVENPDDKVEEKPQEEVKTYLGNVTYTKNIDEKQLDIIVDFLDEYYRSIYELKEYDMTKYFVDSNSNDALINQTAVSTLIEIRKMKDNDLTLKTAKYDLNIKDVQISGDTIKITVLENSYLRFSFMSDIESKIYNITNNFTIKKIDDEYKIVNYNKIQDFYVMITDKYSGGGIDSLNKIKDDYLELTTTKLIKDREDYQTFISGETLDAKVCDHEYNREAALEYALKWVNKRNSEWMIIDGANCQNYVSQILYNGGIAMDYIGSDPNRLQWKYYGSNYNINEQPNGYVYTWTSVPYFYGYAKDNTGLGLCASVDVNMYYAEAGDVIQVGNKNALRHSVIVIGTYKKDGKVVDVLVNSNTVDLENYPMSAYVYPYSNLIKVHGWND